MVTAVLLKKFWPHLLGGILLTALSLVSLRACSLDRDNAVLTGQIKNEKACAAPSYCADAVTRYERDTAQNATKALGEAITEASKVTAAMQQRRDEIEKEAARDRERAARAIAKTQRQLEEAIARDPTCKDWLDQPIGCPVTDPGELWTPDPTRGGFIDRRGPAAESGVPADPAVPDAGILPAPGDAGPQP